MDTIAPVQFSALPDIDEVDPVGPADEPCIAEVREVLARHGALHRFGLTLLHQHFELHDDEILVETIDVEHRTLLTRPVPRETVGQSIETSWRLDDPQAAKRCETLCQSDRDSKGKPFHRKAHYTTS